MDIKKKRKKRELRLCSNPEHCVYKSYFGNKCIAHKRIIWSTCRYKQKPIKQGGAENVNRPLRPFNYSADKLIIADMDSRDKSYITEIEKKINEIADAYNKLAESVKNELNIRVKEVVLQERKEADSIKSEEGKKVDPTKRGAR